MHARLFLRTALVPLGALLAGLLFWANDPGFFTPPWPGLAKCLGIGLIISASVAATFWISPVPAGQAQDAPRALRYARIAFSLSYGLLMLGIFLPRMSGSGIPAARMILDLLGMAGLALLLGWGTVQLLRILRLKAR